MHDLNYQLKGICNSHREGSFATQAARWRCLNLMANQLHDLGFLHLSANGLKPKHVAALLELWKSSSISSATIKNRLAHLRWWAVKIGKSGIIPISNNDLDIKPRVYVTNQSKALSLPQDSLDLISDPFIRISLLLQSAFGLRREESIKFTPSWADKGYSIVLKGSWCKGGQQREVPITNQLQRDILDQAHKLVGSGSLIPHHRSYIQHLKVYESLTSRAGLHKLHGLRHKFAQDRFLELTGVPSSVTINSNSNNISSAAAINNNVNAATSNNNNHHHSLASSMSPSSATSSATPATTPAAANNNSKPTSNNSIGLLSDQRYIPHSVPLTSTVYTSSSSFSASSPSGGDTCFNTNTNTDTSTNTNSLSASNSVPVSVIAPAIAPTSPKLSPEQKALHKQARLIISKELGHHRLHVTSVYLGKPYK